MSTAEMDGSYARIASPGSATGIDDERDGCSSMLITLTCLLGRGTSQRRNTQSRTLPLGQRARTYSSINVNKTRDMAIIRKNKASLATQPSVTGTTRVTSMKILGITVTGKLSVSAHVSNILGSCSSSIYTLKTLRSRGMPAPALHEVARATMLARLTYASPTW